MQDLTLALVADQAAPLTTNVRLHNAAISRGEHIQTLIRVNQMVVGEIDLLRLLDRIIEEARRIAGTMHVRILLVDRDTGGLPACPASVSRAAAKRWPIQACLGPTS